MPYTAAPCTTAMGDGNNGFVLLESPAGSSLIIVVVFELSSALGVSVSKSLILALTAKDERQSTAAREMALTIVIIQLIVSLPR